MGPEYLQNALLIDAVTCSAIDLQRAGPWKYAEDPSTDVKFVSYAFGDGPISQWNAGGPVPAEIDAHVASGLPIVAYGVSFERAIWSHVLALRYQWPKPAAETFYCIAAMAAALALPDAFDQAAAVTGQPRCLSDKRLGGMQQMAQWPRRAAPGLSSSSVIEAERSLFKALKPLLMMAHFEREVWLLDQKINERGITVDIDLVRHAQSVVAEARSKLDADLYRVTGGKVATASQIEKLRAWCPEIQDLQLGNLSHGEIERVLARELDLDPRIREALEIRVEASKTSTSKLPSFLERIGADGRMRDNFVYHGASTGRWTAQGPGLQNLPAHHNFKKIPEAIELIKAGAAAESLRVLAPPLEIVSACLRAMLVAAPGSELIGADYNAVEARGLAWLAGAPGILGLFQRGECPYRHLASLIYRRPAESFGLSSRERQLGKKAVLGLGYQMGWETFLEFLREGRDLHQAPRGSANCQPVSRSKPGDTQTLVRV